MDWFKGDVRMNQGQTWNGVGSKSYTTIITFITIWDFWLNNCLFYHLVYLECEFYFILLERSESGSLAKSSKEIFVS